MKTTFALALGLLLSLGLRAAEQIKPIRGLYISGGCCHDYPQQKYIIPQGISARANVEWTVIEEGGNGTKHVPFDTSTYQNSEWAKGYDIVIHNECFADDADPAYIERALAPHRNGTGAIVIHCTMHTFRALKSDEWREFLGVATFQHGPQHPLDVKNLKPGNPIMKSFPAVFKTGPEELYSIQKVFPGVTVLATAKDKKKENGQWVETDKENAVIWSHTYGKGRVFGTTLAHNNRTMEEPAYLDMLARATLWSCDKLDDSGNPKPGYGPKK